MKTTTILILAYFPKTGVGAYKVKASIIPSGRLAVHRDVVPAYSRRWSVTHIQSGCKVSHDRAVCFPTRKEATRFAVQFDCPALDKVYHPTEVGPTLLKRYRKLISLYETV
jgi:hypothetical protein